MLRRVFLTLMAGLPLASVMSRPALACHDPSYSPTATVAMQTFVRAVLTNDPTSLLIVISEDKPFVIQHDMAEVTGKPASGVEYTRDMVSADLQERGRLYGELMVRRGAKDGLADIVAATGGKDWIQVAPGRFVPPGEKAESPVFVVLRAEWDGWLIDTLGLPAAQSA